MKNTEKSYSWLLEPYETPTYVTFNNFYKQEDIYKQLLEIKSHIDPLHLIKWKNLSYLDATWEPFSKFK